MNSSLQESIISKIFVALDEQNSSSFLEKRIIETNIDLSIDDLVEIFHNSAINEKYFWLNKNEGVLYLGFLRSTESDDGPNFNLRSFDNFKMDGEWEELENQITIYPKLMLIFENAKCRCILRSVDRDEIRSALEKQKSGPSIPKIKRHEFTPDRSTWIENVKACLESFKKGEFKKLVMSRRTSLSFNSKLDPQVVFRRLSEASFNSLDFYFSLNDRVFFGASPERLFVRHGDIIFSDSLAGTRSRGKDDIEDKVIEEKLMNDPKERAEQDHVTKEIISRLEKYSEQVEVSDLTVRKLKNIQHLHREIKAIIPQNIKDEILLNDLHPTPAVGSLPKEGGAEKIKEIEKYNRGYYAGVVGIKNSDYSCYAVAIRSALFDSIFNQLHVYSGAGIVDGSVPEYEWNEINKKLKSILTIFEYDLEQ